MKRLGLVSFLFLGVSICPRVALWADEAEPGTQLLPPLASISNVRDLAPQSLKPKMTVLDTTVSLEGAARPDLGAAFTDTITARLLEYSDFEIIDAGNVTGDFLALPTAQPGKLPSAPGPSAALEVGKAVGVDFVVVPTLVGMGREFRLTMRKLRVPSGKIEAIVQETFQGDLASAFKAFDFVAQRLTPPKPQKPAYTSIKAWMSPPPPMAAPADALASEIATAPKALRSQEMPAEKRAAIEAAKRAWAGVVADQREPQRTGRIEVVDQDWCFCEIACKNGEIQPKDQIFAWSGRDLSTLVTLNVTRVVGSRAIAEFAHHNPNAASLRTGDQVYRWVVAKPKR